MKSFWVLIPALLLFISCNDDQPQPITDSQWKVLSYLPADTQFLVYVNLSELRETEHWKNVFGNSLQSLQPGNWLSEFEQQTGVGLSKGISEVFTAAAWDNNNIIAVTFEDNDTIRNYFLNERKFDSKEANGKTFYQLKNNNKTKFYFADNSTLLIIKNNDYFSALTEGKNKSLKENKNFMRLIGNISNKNHYWFATDKGSYAAELIQRMIGPDKDLPGGRVLSSIQNITLAAQFTDGVALESIIECEDAKSAFMLSTGVRNAIAMDLLSGSNELLGSILHKLELNREEKRINMALEISRNDILKLQNISKRQTDKKL